MARAIDADAIVEEFWKPEYRTQTRRDFIAAIQKWPTLTQPNEPRVINADKLAKRIAGHSNYHGDSILAAIYCAAEGKENDAPIRPIETPPNEPLSIEQLREMDGEPVYLIVDDGYEPLEMWALIDVPEKDHIVLINNIGGMSAYYSDDGLKQDHITVYRRPPEGEENT